MNVRRALRIIHLVSTVWFIACIGCTLALALRQAGIRWWVIFSLSGHSVVIILLLISIYLFAIFKGVSRKQEVIEHPLTSTNYYMLLYGAIPFLGTMAGCIAMIGVNKISQFLLGIAMGTLGATFLGWIIVDPLTGLVEMLLPASRKHRIERLSKAKELREKRQKHREQLLAKVLEKEDIDWQRRQKALMPQAEMLAELLAANNFDFQTECKVADIGVKAWQSGGLSCMRQLHKMAMTICKNESQNKIIVDYISTWWDGIGSWRNKAFCEKIILS
ncbi:MAG: hypothetical protein PHY02_10315 [Phycisphaerae bacterium]|nr:hypothetical protein [Phycisphaerae bacterium]